MGIDIHTYVECDFQNQVEPFTSPDSVRCINAGEFFLWRDLELFHALGLDYWQLDLPPSPLVLGRIPDCMSVNIVEKESLVISPHVDRQTQTQRLAKFPRSILEKWKKDETQYLTIKNHEYYNYRLEDDETLIFDPGCELPNHAYAAEIKHALAFCNVQNEKTDYFLAIVALMEKLEDRLSSKHVRVIYWFDSLGPDFIRDYLSRHGIENNWPKL